MWRFVRETFQRGANHVDVRCAGSRGAPAPAPSPSPPPPPPPPPPHPSYDCRSEPRWFQRQLVDAWINAFTWSGAVVLGWYASQLSCLRRKRLLWEDYRQNDRRRPFCLYKNLPTTALTRVAFAQPAKLVRRENVAGLFPVNVSDDRAPEESSANSADDDFKNVVRSIENKLGISAIEEGKVHEGFSMLQSSARKNYAPALFNLALCYERGLGVKKNEKMALELYRAAAIKEHADATYNLAVFYGQGRAGLPRDTRIAEDLLRIAAAKGQRAAQTALQHLHNKKLSKLDDKLRVDAESDDASFLRSIGCEEKINRVAPVLLY